MRRQIQVKKAAWASIVINAIQIVAVAAIALAVLFTDIEHQSPYFVELLVLLAAVIIVWGAVVDIQQAFMARQTSVQAQMLADAYGNLESLNVTMRAQRHDFMNHLQVVGSLLEMDEHDEALQYIEKLYGDIQSVSTALRTGNPAINALLSAKLGECQAEGVFLELRIHSAFDQLPMEGWEMCRVLGNLIDNALDALSQTPDPRITVTLSEESDTYAFSIENNGPPISDQDLPHLFERGYTTKGHDHGMGLSIVKEILEGVGGSISAVSTADKTAFHALLPRAALKKK